MKDWENEFDKLFGDLMEYSLGYKEDEDEQWNNVTDQVKIFIRSQRQDLLKSLVEEVGGMKLIILEHDKKGKVIETDPTLSFPKGYNRCLQDVIKLLENYEK